MAEADELCDLLFLWLNKRKHCAEKLLVLAKELEDLHKAATVSQVVGSATSVLALTTAGAFTLFTGGLATPLLVATVGTTIAGAAVDVASTGIEAFISSGTMKEAKNIIQEDEKIGKDIQKAIENLKEKCGVQQDGAHGSTDVDCEVVAQIMGALARRNNVDVPLGLFRVFARTMFIESRLHANPAIPQMLILSVVTLCLQLGISSFAVGAKGLGRSAAFTGVKAASKAGVKILGVIGVGITLYSLFSSCEEMIKRNQGTKASQALRDAAREIQKARRTLKEQLDAMNKIANKMLDLKNRIKNLREYSLNLTETGQKIIDYVIESCTDDEVISWLKMIPHQIEFINLLYFLSETLRSDRLKKSRGGHINIVIVAHGEITDRLMTPSLLVPPPNIINTVVYSPWNCFIDASAACAIAEGWNNTEGRGFYHLNTNQPVHFEPNPLPNCWNHMQRSLYSVPEILLTPVYPEETVWMAFINLQGHMDIDDRVIIPFLVPKLFVNAFKETPFYMFIFALSYIVMIFNKTATVHLAACLGRKNSEPLPAHWRAQYAFTYDGAIMTARNRVFSNQNLLQAFRAMFDRNNR